MKQCSVRLCRLGLMNDTLSSTAVQWGLNFIFFIPVAILAMYSMCCTQYGTTLKVFIFARWPHRFLLCFLLSILPAVRCYFLRFLLHRQRLARGLFCKAWYVTEWSRRRIAIATGRENSFIFRRGRKPSFLPFLRSETLMRVCVCHLRSPS